MKHKNRLVVGDAEWAKDLPEWLLEEIKAERITLSMASIIHEMPDHKKVGDAEIVAYLMTAALRAPLSHDYTEIYVYLTGRLMQKQGKELDDFLQKKLEQGLSDHEQMELRHLKSEIFHLRGGEIETPLLKVLREFKRSADKAKSDPQISLFQKGGIYAQENTHHHLPARPSL
jgi:hypothetical protein